MKSVLERQYSVDISNVDMYMNLSLVSLMKFFQDMHMQWMHRVSVGDMTGQTKWN